jgi:hypothetical protein
MISPVQISAKSVSYVLCFSSENTEHSELISNGLKSKLYLKFFLFTTLPRGISHQD